MNTVYPLAVSLAGTTAANMVDAAGRWIAGYLLLSLTLALIWIAMVTAGRFYQRHLAANEAGRCGPRLPFGSQHWRREREEFWRQLLQMENSLGSRRPGGGNVPASLHRKDS